MDWILPPPPMLSQSLVANFRSGVFARAVIYGTIAACLALFPQLSPFAAFPELSAVQLAVRNSLAHVACRLMILQLPVLIFLQLGALWRLACVFLQLSRPPLVARIAIFYAALPWQLLVKRFEAARPVHPF